MVKRGKMEVLKRYNFLQEVGSGGFSRVYKATVKGDSEPVAIKVVRIAEDNDELKAIIENEVEVMRAVTKDLSSLKANFVQFYDVVYDFEQMSIVMEYLDGGELFDRIVQRTKFSENDASKLMRQIIRALDALHSHGIIHRDLKPENLVYATRDKNSDIKIMDFGLSWFMGEKDIQKSAKYVGTPGYIAPEVILRKKYGPEGDIWSMGVILFILLSGRMPFGGRNTNMMHSKVITGSFTMTSPAWKHISKSAKDLIQKMLTVDPAKRITAKEVLEHRWIVEDHTGFNLGVTLTRLADFNERRKIENEIKKVFNQTSNKMQKQLIELIGNTTENTFGLTLNDINRVRKAFMSDKGDVLPPTEVRISRVEFIETMTKLGFAYLPLDEIFTTLNNGYTDQSVIEEDIRRRGPSFVETDMRWREQDGEPKIQLDEILIGLSTVAVVESKERLLHFLYDSFSHAENEKGLSARGLVKILRVFASYDRPKDRNRVDEIAARIKQLFTPFESDDADQTVGISYEEFKKGISNFSDDIFQAFFVEPMKLVGEKLEHFKDRWIDDQTREKVDETINYISKIGSYATSIGGRWNNELDDGNLEENEAEN